MEFHLTRAALEGARRAEASHYTPKLWSLARKEYAKAIRHYKVQRNYKAKEALERAKEWAEEAELKSLIKKSDEGGLSF